MAQYINKDVVIAEIEKRIASLEGVGSENYLHDNYPEQYAMLVTLKSLKFSIDTLEVEEVDLEKEIENYLSSYWPNEKELYPFLGHMAKQFFKLGMTTSNKAQKREEV